MSCKIAPAAASPREPMKADAPNEQPSSSETSCDEIAVTGSQEVKKVVKYRRRKFKNELTTRLVAAARAALAAPETGQLPLKQQH